MRKAVSLSIQEEVLKWAFNKADQKYLSLSRYVETLLIRAKEAEEVKSDK